jgi:hypothetical protein
MAATPISRVEPLEVCGNVHPRHIVAPHEIGVAASSWGQNSAYRHATT